MNRKAFTRMLAYTLHQSERRTDQTLRVFIREFRAALARGEKVVLRGIATFTVVETPERLSHVGTKGMETIPAHRRVKVRLHQSLKDLVK